MTANLLRQVYYVAWGDLMFMRHNIVNILVMDKGKIVGAGPTKDVLTSENIKNIFQIDAVVEYDDRVKGLNVVMIGK